MALVNRLGVGEGNKTVLLSQECEEVDVPMQSPSWEAPRGLVWLGGQRLLLLKTNGNRVSAKDTHL